MPSSQKLVALALPVGLNILNLPPPVASLQEAPTMDSSNRYKVTPQLLFEIKLHGFLLWASVGLLMPAAILVKRMSNREESGKRLRIIFYIHAITQVVSVLLATAAAVMSIKYFDNSFNNDHQRIGLAFYVIMWLQALAGICRPHRVSKSRNIWFVFHWLVGIVVSLLGVINIYTGLQAYHKRTLKNVRIWTILFTVQISLTLFLYLLQEKWHYIQKQGPILGNKPVQPTGDREMFPTCQQKETTSEHC
ncbi:cytochrome b561 domain-containing protein At4g18260-like [Salvia miltiorrhiza]|uniref:cytochrome b561 domain-containing protein At4g18260-like n=1 Tax=Salvia miltiorrhiza TaxID=226208 RepID=UPI0025ACB37C|nr:cytochrome b561 domain-containing protein At4g18260-like [Salvia miltiorrhiza]